MNERIKKFAEQAGFETGLVYGNPEGLQKFAELIVGECLALSKSQLVSIPDNQEDWDGHNYGFTAAVCEFEDLVKEHFGVEK